MTTEPEYILDTNTPPMNPTESAVQSVWQLVQESLDPDYGPGPALFALLTGALHLAIMCDLDAEEFEALVFKFTSTYDDSKYQVLLANSPSEGQA